MRKFFMVGEMMRSPPHSNSMDGLRADTTGEAEAGTHWRAPPQLAGRTLAPSTLGHPCRER
ncbi:hypothetical protein E2C01_027135 [Portunus trituberculatus]|uniref:Uncharacterized protein n=1 Tax=Portunus trituberculatus TaxID=210409 RepID=A0A5B7EL57_PORTR|nr:hypothetical protein [Portunus trituberculatus]